MADPPIPQLLPGDTVTSLLGWDSAQKDAAENDVDWKSLHARVRTTTDGVEAFKRAVKRLSTQHGRIVFLSREDAKGSPSRDPLLIVRAYFRLLRCSLEPVEENSEPTIITENELNQFIKTLLKNLGSALKSSIQQQIEWLNDLESSEQGTFNRANRVRRNDAIILHFTSMIEYVIPHVGRNSAILGSTYKIFCESAELFVSLLEFECNKIGEHVQSFLPIIGWPALSNVQQDVEQIISTWESCNDCLARAACCLLGLIEDGLIRVQQALPGEQSWTSNPDGYYKIIIFMMARAVSLIFLRKKRFRQNNPTGQGGLKSEKNASSNNCNGRESELISRCLSLLIKLRGISVLVYGCLEDPSCRCQLNDNRRQLFEMIVGLGQKVDIYAVKMLCLDIDQDANQDDICLGLKCLAELPNNELNIALSITGEANKNNSSENVLPLGKLFVVKHILKTVTCSSRGAVSTTCDSTVLIQLCQNTIFDILPRCYHIFQIRTSHHMDLPLWASTLISDLVNIMTKCTLTFFRSSKEKSRDAMVRQHQLLIRWLAGSQHRIENKSQSCRNHPFSNEIVMCILQARISSNTDKSNQDKQNLISLMAKLVFHPRTESLHRSLIASVLARLLRSSDVSSSCDSGLQNARATAIRLLWKEINTSNNFNSTRSDGNKKSSKRKRLISSNYFPTIELYDMLALLVEACVSSQLVIDGEAIMGMRLFFDTIFFASDRNNKKSYGGGTGLDNKQFYEMSLLTGLMRCQPNIASIQRILSHNQDVIESADPCSFIDGSIRLVEFVLSSGRRKSRVSTQHYACLQFIAALITIFRTDFSESQVIGVGNLINRMYADSLNLFTKTFETACKENLLLSTSCKLGSVIQANFSSESLKVREGHLLSVKLFESSFTVTMFLVLCLSLLLASWANILPDQPGFMLHLASPYYSVLLHHFRLTIRNRFLVHSRSLVMCYNY